MADCTPERSLPKQRVGDPAKLKAALDALETMAVVKTVDCDPRFRDGRVIAWALWCSSQHEKKDRQPYVALNNKPLDDPEAVPTYQVAAERLIAKIEQKHCGCIEAAEAAKAAAAIGSAQAGTSETAQLDAFAAMRRVQELKAIAFKANAEALAAEKAKDAAEAELAAFERALDAKRRRVEEPAIDEAAEPEQATTEWDLADHRREMSRVMNRREIEIGSDERERELRTGRDGYLHHPRTGLVGAVAYWALGSTALAVVMIVALVRRGGAEREALVPPLPR
jgi:hypothetical protein